jgi:hypothetical protein
MLLAVALYTSQAFASDATGARGEGAASISGVSISNVHYQLAAADPAVLEAVQLTLMPGAGTVPSSVMLQLAPSAPWYECRPLAGTTWACETPGAALRTATVLRFLSAS